MMRYICTILIAFLSYAASAQTTQILGAPGTRIATKGDMSVDSIFYLPRTLVTSRSPAQSGALRYQSSDSSLYQWTGTQWVKVTGGIFSVAGQTNYLPKYTSSSTLGNSAMYDSAGQLRINKNFIGIGGHQADNYIAQRVNVDGFSGYPMLLQQNDSIQTAAQLVLKLRKGLLTSDKPRPNYGVGIEMQLQDDAGSWRRSALIINRITDTMAANYKSQLQFLMNHGDTNTYTTPFRIFSDSTIRVARLAGTGTRNVVANANGDLRVGSGSEGIDSLLFATRAWRQKGDDSVAALTRVTSVASGFGTNFSTITSTGSVVVDSLVMTSRASRDKLKDSLQANINAKGSGTVTSVSAGTGMSFTTITSTGSVVVDSVIMATRARVQKAVDSLGSVKQNTLTNPVTGTGTTNRVAKFTGTSTIGDGGFVDLRTTEGMRLTSAGRLLVGTTTEQSFLLEVNGTARTGTLTVNTNGDDITVSTNKATGTNGANIFIGNAGSSLTGTSGGQSSFNTTLGINAGNTITTGEGNTAVGINAQNQTTTASGNTAVGRSALRLNTTGGNNVALGRNALESNTTGIQNTAVGANALNLSTSNNSTAVGFEALKNQTSGNNSAFGVNALTAATTGDNNAAFGRAALSSLTTGVRNMGIGTDALSNITTTSDNIGIGSEAGKLVSTGGNNITGNQSIFIGGDARPAADAQGNQIVIGHSSRGNGSNTVTIGNSSITHNYFRGEMLVGYTSDQGTFSLQANGNALIGGSIRATTIDSSASPINMLWSDVNGVIRKTAVPTTSVDTNTIATRARLYKTIDSMKAVGVTMSEDVVTIESGWNFSRPVGSPTPTSQVVKTTNGSITTISLNIAVHRTTATFTEDSWVKVGSLPSGFRPNNTIHGQLPSIVSGDEFQSQSNVAFTATMKTSGHMAFRIQPDGDVQVNVDQVTASVDLSGANYVLFPIAITFSVLTLTN